jgi:hypothetical protein
MSKINFRALLRALPVLPKSPPAHDAALLEANRERRERLNKLVRQQPAAALGVLSYWLHSRS